MRTILTRWAAELGAPPWIVPDYGFMLALSIVAGAWLTLRTWRRSGGDRALGWELVLWAIPWLGVGARLLFCAQYGWKGWIGSWSLHGLSLYGGLLGVLAAWGVIRLLRTFSLRRFLDCATPALALGLFLTRLGCFLHGCNGGVPTRLPWAVRFPPDTPVYLQQRMDGLIDAGSPVSLPVHPAQLYESAFGLASLLLLQRLIAKKLPEGQLFLTGVLWYAVFRFASEWLRGDAAGLRPFGIFTFSQFVSICVVGLALFGLTRVAKQHEPANPRAGTGD
jgi:phosphatidylglycerol:prolipoprotein diacylglycerol transferase